MPYTDDKERSEEENNYKSNKRRVIAIITMHLVIIFSICLGFIYLFNR